MAQLEPMSLLLTVPDPVSAPNKTKVLTTQAMATEEKRAHARLTAGLFCNKPQIWDFQKP